MGSQKLPKAPKPPDPVPVDIANTLADDLVKDEMKRRKGSKASLLTSRTNTSKMLGKNSSLLGKMSNG